MCQFAHPLAEIFYILGHIFAFNSREVVGEADRFINAGCDALPRGRGLRLSGTPAVAATVDARAGRGDAAVGATGEVGAKRPRSVAVRQSARKRGAGRMCVVACFGRLVHVA
jgi:hypothetical protein